MNKKNKKIDMKKIVKLTESDLNRIVKKTIKEEEFRQPEDWNLSSDIRADIIDDIDNIPPEEVPMYLKEIIEFCEELAKAYDGWNYDTGEYDDSESM